MPELPEVEVLVRHLAPLLKNRTVRQVTVQRAKTISPASAPEWNTALRGARFDRLTRRGKYLVLRLGWPGRKTNATLLVHLGMTGRLYLQPAQRPWPKHAAVVFHLGRVSLVFEDPRYFGRLSLDPQPLTRLGPEPLDDSFTLEYLRQALRRSSQAIKIRLLDQALVAGIGNIYASEALFQAGISPRLSARRLSPAQVGRLWQAIRDVLSQAIAGGSTVPLDWAGTPRGDRLFYYGRAADTPEEYAERLTVYDRQGRPCVRCGRPIQRLRQAGRSTYFCPHCQRAR